MNLFELLLALAVLSFLGLQQTGKLLLLLGQDVLLELLLLSQDSLGLKAGEKVNGPVISGQVAQRSRSVDSSVTINSNSVPSSAHSH